MMKTGIARQTKMWHASILTIHWAVALMRGVREDVCGCLYVS
jgi:hypothetical protein